MGAEHEIIPRSTRSPDDHRSHDLLIEFIPQQLSEDHIVLVRVVILIRDFPRVLSPVDAEDQVEQAHVLSEGWFCGLELPEELRAHGVLQVT